MKKVHSNYMELKFPSRSENESFARVAVASFVSQLDPTMEELTDIKTVVSEAVTNAVIHGYEEREDGIITIRTEIEGSRVFIEIRDEGVGIRDIDQARQPCSRRNPNWSAPEWALPSWRTSWMRWRSSPNPAGEPPSEW